MTRPQIAVVARIAGHAVLGSRSSCWCFAVQFGSSEVVKLREEANKLFGRKEYLKALESYDKALKAIPEDGSTEDRALLHSNKAACYMMQQK